MVFSSYEFVYLFLPITIAVYFLLSKFVSRKIQHIFLVSASLFFYGYFNVYYLWIIVASIAANFLLSSVMARYDNNIKIKKLMLILGIIFNLGMLGYYKYYDFFVGNINSVFGTSFNLLGLLLPLGISFFTFQQFSFLISVYQGTSKANSFVEYCLFVTFFPQLVAGPIVLYEEMMPQFCDDKLRFVNFNNIAKGAYIFSMGLFKKIVIADTVALFVNNGFALDTVGLAPAWAISLCYTLQIYFDFSGYSDMAIGIGKMFNINLPTNFNSPYKSKSITEFWRRWHITLGRALSTYVYIPLGGNRKGTARTLINLFIVFMASGLWHGAAWTFIVWGALHGVAVVFERVAKKYLEKIPGFVRTACTFLYVNFLWVLFRAPSFDSALKIFKGMFDFTNLDISALYSLTIDGIVGLPRIISLAYIGFMLIGLLTIVFFTKNTIEKAESFSLSNKYLLATSGLFIVSTVHLSRLSTFIYFNF